MVRRPSAIDTDSARTKGEWDYAVETGTDFVAIDTAFLVADDDVCDRITIQYRSDLVSGRIAVQRSQVALTLTNHGHWTAPLQFVASPTKNCRGARVGGHAGRQ